MPSSPVRSVLSPGSVRLFLALIVVVHHSLPFRAGSWAVDVFFILSGYWITRMWSGHYSRTKSPYFTFLVSRWWRLLPVFLICTCLGVGSAYILRSAADVAAAWNPGWWLRQALIIGSADAGRVLPPTWSLDVEMQFYLIAPLLVWAFARFSIFWRWMAVAVLVLTLACLLATGTYPESARFVLFSGFFLAGIALAMQKWIPGNKLVLAALMLFCAGTLVLIAVPQTRGGIWIEGKAGVLGVGRIASMVAPMWWVAGAVLVIPFLARSLAIRSSQVDRTLGELAYPLYLFHWIPREWYYHFCDSNPPATIRFGLLLANLAMAIAGAVLILFLIDRPLERARRAWVASREIEEQPAGRAEAQIRVGDVS
jgi:peptidoglycan/LPS O-acetylase OafA/YrhL